jgi:hypothetical protein
MLEGGKACGDASIPKRTATITCTRNAQGNPRMSLKKLGNLKKLAAIAAWARDGLAEAERKHGIEAEPDRSANPKPPARSGKSTRAVRKQ